MVTDFLRYKPIVLLNAISNFTVQMFLIFTRSKTDMQVRNKTNYKIDLREIILALKYNVSMPNVYLTLKFINNYIKKIESSIGI